MAFYLVHARPKNLSELKQKLDTGEIKALRPFGGEMHQCLSHARLTADGLVVWEEQCFCTPPLRQERTVLDQYFSEITTQTVEKGGGWVQIAQLSPLWPQE